jgi:hypothetical protein
VSDLPHRDARPTALSSTVVLTAVLTTSLVAWAVAVQQMRGMDAGPAPTWDRLRGSSASG